MRKNKFTEEEIDTLNSFDRIYLKLFAEYKGLKYKIVGDIRTRKGKITIKVKSNFFEVTRIMNLVLFNKIKEIDGKNKKKMGCRT